MLRKYEKWKRTIYPIDWIKCLVQDSEIIKYNNGHMKEKQKCCEYINQDDYDSLHSQGYNNNSSF